jgi:hypothetical protein
MAFGREWGVLLVSHGGRGGIFEQNIEVDLKFLIKIGIL